MKKTMIIIALAAFSFTTCGKKDDSKSTPPVKPTMTGAPVATAAAAQDLIDTVLTESLSGIATSPEQKAPTALLPLASATASDSKAGKCGGTLTTTATLTGSGDSSMDCSSGKGTCSGNVNASGTLYYVDFCNKSGTVLNGYLNIGVAFSCPTSSSMKSNVSISGPVYVSGTTGAKVSYNGLSVSAEGDCTKETSTIKGTITVTSNDGKVYTCEAPTGTSQSWVCK